MGNRWDNALLRKVAEDAAGDPAVLQVNPSGELLVDAAAETPIRETEGDTVTGPILQTIAGRTEAGTVLAAKIGDDRKMRVRTSFDRDHEDAYGRLRVGRPWASFDSFLDEAVNMASWETITTGTGAYAANANRPSGTLSTTAAADSVIREQHGYNHTPPGRGSFVVLSTVLGAGQADVTKRVGLFNTADGFFFEQDGTGGLYVVRRTSTSGSPVDTRVAQASWNMDVMDGSGASGVTLDPAMIQSLVIESQWMGSGILLFGVIVGQEPIYVHEFEYTNLTTEEYTSSPALPVRYEITQGGATAGSLVQVAAAVSSEAGAEIEGVRGSASRGTSAKTLPGGARQSLLSIRLRATVESGRVNRRIVIPTGISVLSDKQLLLEIVVQHSNEATPTFGGTPTWTSAGTYSGVESAPDVTTVGAGNIPFQTYMDAGSKNDSRSAAVDVSALLKPSNYLSMDSAGTGSDYLHVVATNLEAQSALILAALTWQEIT